MIQIVTGSRSPVRREAWTSKRRRRRTGQKCEKRTRTVKRNPSKRGIQSGRIVEIRGEMVKMIGGENAETIAGGGMMREVGLVEAVEIEETEVKPERAKMISQEGLVEEEVVVVEEEENPAEAESMFEEVVAEVVGECHLLILLEVVEPATQPEEVEAGEAVADMKADPPEMGILPSLNSKVISIQSTVRERSMAKILAGECMEKRATCL